MRRFLSLTVNAFLFVAVLLIWSRMALRFDARGIPVALQRESLRWLRYFTVLANLLCGLAALCHLAATQLWLCGTIARVPAPVRMLKLAATSALALTLATVAGWIGPRTGYRTAFSGVNLWFHLILPLAALADWLLLEREGAVRLRQTLWALPFPAAYGAYYVVRLLREGGRADLYGFAAFGMGAVPVVAAAVLLAAWLIGVILWLPRRHA